MPVTDLADLDLERIDRAHREFRLACAHLVAGRARDRGLLPRAGEFSAADLVADAAAGVDTSIIGPLLAAVLEHCGAITRVGPDRFRSAAEPPAFTPDPVLIKEATGMESLEDYPDWSNFTYLIDEILDGDGATAAGFTNANLILWEAALQAPYYRYSRLRAVAALARTGPRLLDLACGLGHGLQELSDALGGDPQARLVGVEVSPEFAALAAERTAADPGVHVIEADLDRPLPQLQDGGFDGAMIVGGYHFLTDPGAFWSSMRRTIRPGGALVLAHVLSRTGSPDGDLMELRFALRRPPGRPAEREDLIRLAGESGFSLREEFALGCYLTLEFTRLDEAQPAGRPGRHRHDELTVETIPVGPLRTNAYLLRCNRTGRELLIDAGAEPEVLLAHVTDLAAIVTTHGDWDHTGGLRAVAAATGARVLAHRDDLALLGHPGEPLDHGDAVRFGDCEATVIHLGGHTPGSIALAVQADTATYLFTGDALFPGGVGTTWGDREAFAELLGNVEDRLFRAYTDATVVLPGHGPATTIGEQRPHLEQWRTRGW